MSDNDTSDDDATNVVPAERFRKSILGFQRLRTADIDRFNLLEWTNISRDIINELFPIRVGKYGRLDHPVAYLKSTALVERWRTIGGDEQQNVIDRLKEEEERERNNQMRAAGRERRASGRRGGDDNLARTPTNKSSTKKKLRVEQQVDEDDGIVGTPLIGTSGHTTNPPQLLRRFSELKMSDDDNDDDDGDGAFVDVHSSTCRGISIATIDASKIKEKDKVRTGYAHAVGNAHRSTAHYLSNNNAEWPFGQDIAGYLMNHNANDGDEHIWVCKRIVEDEEMVRFSFFHKRCTGVVESGTTGLCTECKTSQYRLYRTCREEVDKREAAHDGPMLTGRIDYHKFNTPSILMPGIEEYQKQIHVLRTKMWKKNLAIKLLRQQEIAVEGVNHDILFDEKTLHEAYSKLGKESEVKEKQMMDILYQECMVVRRRMNERGNAKGHIYTPLMIRFAIMLRKKVSQDNYDFFRRVFGLPTNATLCEYKNADTTSEDGIMHETCMQQAQWMIDKNIPLRDFKRYVAMSFDSHVIRDKLGELYILT